MEESELVNLYMLTDGHAERSYALHIAAQASVPTEGGWTYF